MAGTKLKNQMWSGTEAGRV